MESIRDSETVEDSKENTSLEDGKTGDREKRERLRKNTEELIASVISSPIAIARLSGPIQKR